jgi:predicted nucleotidyltransferase
MPTAGLARTLFSEARVGILSSLSAAGEAGLHLREIARQTGLNSKTVMRELHALRDAGILAARPAGLQVFYRLNPDCPIADELRSIIRKTVGLTDVLRAALSPFSDRIVQAYVYGSHARGEERVDSDVDLMIVGSVSLRELSSPLREAGRRLRRTVNPTLYSAEDYADERKTRGSFVSRVHRGPRLELLGAGHEP